MGFRQQWIEPAGFPEELSRLEVGRPRDLMKTPCSPSDEVPSSHVAGVSCRREIQFRLEQLGLDFSDNPLGNSNTLSTL